MAPLVPSPNPSTQELSTTSSRTLRGLQGGSGAWGAPALRRIRVLRREKQEHGCTNSKTGIWPEPQSCGSRLCREGPDGGHSLAKAEISVWEHGSSHPAPPGNGWLFQLGIWQLTPKEWGGFPSSSGHTHGVKTHTWESKGLIQPQLNQE